MGLMFLSPLLVSADITISKNAEALKRTAKFNAILGGAEEVLGDLGVRQAMRKMPSDVRL